MDIDARNGEQSGDLVNVTFALADATRLKSHSAEWEFYEGRWMAYFANRPFAWWPEDGPYPFTVESTPDWSAKIDNYSTSAPTTVTLRLPRSLLGLERRVPYSILGDADA
jgi:hypothetical protein